LGLDYRAVFGSIAKWVTEIDDAARVPELISRAFHVATSGRPGPVVIALPEDMLVERVVAADAPACDPVETSPGPADMRRLQTLLNEAQRPIALLGGSRWSKTACAAMQQFAERFMLPVATTFRRAHLFDPAPLLCGRLGIGPNPSCSRVEDADRHLIGGARRDAVAELHAVRHSRTQADAGACASGRRGTWPGLPARAGD
jgi:acetolactate synthase-1/2/3 large subunit